MWSQLPRKGHSSPPLFGPCLWWPRSPISATAELLFIFSHNLCELQCTCSIVSAAFVYQPWRRVYLAPEERPPQTQWRHCHSKNVCHWSLFSAVGTNRSRRMLDLANVVDEVLIFSRIQPQQTSQQQRCGQACYHAAEELHVVAFLDACFSMLHVIYVVQQHNMHL